MKLNRKNPLLAASVAITVVLSAHSAQAQTTRYRDANGTTTGFGNASGTWTDPTVNRWSDGTGAAAGDATPGASVTTNILDPLNFGIDVSGKGLGNGTIMVTGTVDAASIKFGSQTTGNGLTSTQLGLISASGFTGFGLDTNGYLTASVEVGFSS